MDTYHPVTPPPDLVLQLQDLGNLDAIREAYRAGADHELEALLELADQFLTPEQMRYLREIRRPKPPSLKERIATAIAHGDTSIALALLDKALPD